MRVLPVALLLSLAACAVETQAPPAASGGGTPDTVPDTAMVQAVTVGGTAALLAEGPGASTSVAVQTIDRWIARLDTAALADGPALREDLGLLRDQLLSYPQDGPAIGTTMRRLGTRTGALADSAAGLAGLAAALETAGAQLGGDSPDASEATET